MPRFLSHLYFAVATLAIFITYPAPLSATPILQIKSSQLPVPDASSSSSSPDVVASLTDLQLKFNAYFKKGVSFSLGRHWNFVRTTLGLERILYITNKDPVENSKLSFFKGKFEGRQFTVEILDEPRDYELRAKCKVRKEPKQGKSHFHYQKQLEEFKRKANQPQTLLIGSDVDFLNHAYQEQLGCVVALRSATFFHNYYLGKSLYYNIQ